MAYLSVFMSALLAATLIPAQSEGLLIALILEGSSNFWWLIMAAGSGNTLGSVINWGLGGYLERFQNRSWFPVNSRGLQIAQKRFQTYGLWSLLLSWVPVIGDPLTIVAGFMRVRFLPFLLVVAVAKFGRYLLIGLPVYCYQG